MSMAPRISISVRARPPDHRAAPIRSRRHHSSSTASARATGWRTPRTVAAPCVPGPTISQVMISWFRNGWTAEVKSPARIHGVAPGASICSPRLSCSVRNDATCEKPPAERDGPDDDRRDQGGGDDDAAPRATHGEEHRQQQRARCDLDPRRRGEQRRRDARVVERDRQRDDDHRGDDTVETTHGDRAEQQQERQPPPRAGRGAAATGPVGTRCPQEEPERDRVEHGHHQGPHGRVLRAAAGAARCGREHRQDGAGRIHPTAREHRPLALVQTEPHPVAVELEVPEGPLGDPSPDRRTPATRAPGRTRPRRRAWTAAGDAAGPPRT